MPIKDTGFSFDAKNESAQAYVEDYGAELIQGISKTTREDIKDLLDLAFDGEMNVEELADSIGTLIGSDTRAELIARTETMKAANAGQQEAWDQAVDDGLLTGDEKQVWITAPDERLCPICDEMDGQEIALGESFDVDGEELDGPPAHPNCRCTVGLVA